MRFLNSLATYKIRSGTTNSIVRTRFDLRTPLSIPLLAVLMFVACRTVDPGAASLLREGADEPPELQMNPPTDSRTVTQQAILDLNNYAEKRIAWRERQMNRERAEAGLDPITFVETAVFLRREDAEVARAQTTCFFEGGLFAKNISVRLGQHLQLKEQIDEAVEWLGDQILLRGGAMAGNNPVNQVELCSEAKLTGARYFVLQGKGTLRLGLVKKEVTFRKEAWRVIPTASIKKLWDAGGQFPNANGLSRFLWREFLNPTSDTRAGVRAQVADLMAAALKGVRDDHPEIIDRSLPLGTRKAALRDFLLRILSNAKTSAINHLIIRQHEEKLANAMAAMDKRELIALARPWGALILDPQDRAAYRAGMDGEIDARAAADLVADHILSPVSTGSPEQVKRILESTELSQSLGRILLAMIPNTEDGVAFFNRITDDMVSFLTAKESVSRMETAVVNVANSEFSVRSKLTGVIVVDVSKTFVGNLSVQIFSQTEFERFVDFKMEAELERKLRGVIVVDVSKQVVGNIRVGIGSGFEIAGLLESIL